MISLRDKNTSTEKSYWLPLPLQQFFSLHYCRYTNKTLSNCNWDGRSVILFPVIVQNSVVYYIQITTPTYIIQFCALRYFIYCSYISTNQYILITKVLQYTFRVIRNGTKNSDKTIFCVMLLVIVSNVFFLGFRQNCFDCIMLYLGHT